MIASKPGAEDVRLWPTESLAERLYVYDRRDDPDHQMRGLFTVLQEYQQFAVMAKSLSGQNFVPSKPKKHVKVMDHVQNRPMDVRSIVVKENVNSSSNDQSSLRVVRRQQLRASPALAEGNVYVNPEFNGGSYGDDWLGGTLNLDVGYETSSGAYSFYIRAVLQSMMPDGEDQEFEWLASSVPSLLALMLLYMES